jgi:Putative auto-transporter adhesin, head GIN domain
VQYRYVSVTSPTTGRRTPRRRSIALLFLALLGLIVLIVVLTQNGSPVVTQTRSVPAFNAVELAGSNVVTVQVGKPQSVAIRAHRNMLGRVTTEVHAGTLVIGNVPSRTPTKGPMSVSVAVPSLASLTIPSGGSGIITVTRVNASAFSVVVAGSGLVVASGAATRLDVSVSGSGDAELEELAARDATASSADRGGSSSTRRAASTRRCPVPGSSSTWATRSTCRPASPAPAS